MYRSPLWIFFHHATGTGCVTLGGNSTEANLANANFTDDLQRLCDDAVNFTLNGTFLSCIVRGATDNETPLEEDLCSALPSPVRHSKFPILLTVSSIRMLLRQ